MSAFLDENGLATLWGLICEKFAKSNDVNGELDEMIHRIIGMDNSINEANNAVSAMGETVGSLREQLEYTWDNSLHISGGQMTGKVTFKGVALTKNVDYFDSMPTNLSSIPDGSLIFVKV